MIKLNNEDLEDLLFCSFRYALGRRTCITWTIATLLIRHRNDVSDGFREMVAKEIGAAIPTGEAGMDMDVDEWRKVQEEYLK